MRAHYRKKKGKSKTFSRIFFYFGKEKNLRENKVSDRMFLVTRDEVKVLDRAHILCTRPVS